jgi:hypothetical protein
MTSATSGMDATHACCAKGGAAKAVSAKAVVPKANPAGCPPTDSCPCIKLPPATAPAAQLTPLLPLGLVFSAPDRVYVPVAPERARAFTRGAAAGPSPPLLDLGAHGLRAPPELL